MHLVSGQLYSFDAMLTALMAAGQFVHVSQKQMERELKSIPSLIAGHKGNIFCEHLLEARLLCRAITDGHCPPIFEPHITTELIAKRRGTFCAVCGHVKDGNSVSMWSLNNVAEFLCPTAMKVSFGDECFSAPDVFCDDCRKIWLSCKHEDTIFRKLGLAIKRSDLRDRITRNAPSWHSARFDPRHTIGGAS